jgi:hypothetical protein
MPISKEVDFYIALEHSDIHTGSEIKMAALLRRAVSNIESANVPVDAIVSFNDFSAALLVQILAKRFDAKSPDVKDIFKCETKYWNRMKHQNIIPGRISQYVTNDTIDDSETEKVPSVFFFPNFFVRRLKNILFTSNDQIYFQI